MCVCARTHVNNLNYDFLLIQIIWGILTMETSAKLMRTVYQTKRKRLAVRMRWGWVSFTANCAACRNLPKHTHLQPARCEGNWLAAYCLLVLGSDSWRWALGERRWGKQRLDEWGHSLAENSGEAYDVIITASHSLAAIVTMTPSSETRRSCLLREVTAQVRNPEKFRVVTQWHEARTKRAP
jgi:hypothetical protein